MGANVLQLRILGALEQAATLETGAASLPKASPELPHSRQLVSGEQALSG